VRAAAAGSPLIPCGKGVWGGGRVGMGPWGERKGEEKGKVHALGGEGVPGGRSQAAPTLGDGGTGAGVGGQRRAPGVRVPVPLL